MDAPDNGSNLSPLRVGYLIPEFPGQTHIWMWREIEWLRRWADDVHIYSTRKPGERDRARHAFATTSASITTFLWPIDVVGSVLWAVTQRPQGFLAAVQLCRTLPIEQSPSFLHLLKLLPSACFLARSATEKQLTHLHSHSCASAAILAMMVKRITGIGFSLTLNANLDWWGGAMSEKFVDANFTIAITEWLLAQIRRDYPNVREDQALLGRIGVDTQSWSVKKLSPEREGPFKLVTVARLHFSKGHDTLIDAFKLLVDAGRDVVLRVVGDGPQREDLERQVADLGLTERVVFTGSVSEQQVKEEILAADAFALASHAEPLGVVYMEAMACGVPTVGTNAGGVAEIITNGHDGLLVEPKNPDAIATALGQVMDDHDLAGKLARNGRQTIVDRFDSRIGAATLYQKITGCEPPATAD